MTPQNISESMFKTGGIPSKAKPRNFNADPKVLTIINGQNYDMIDDMNKLQINVEAALEKLKK